MQKELRAAIPVELYQSWLGKSDDTRVSKKSLTKEQETDSSKSPVAKTPFQFNSVTSSTKDDAATDAAASPCASVVLPEWLQKLDHSVERKVFSQYNEDGVTEYLIQHVEIVNKFYVEFGTESGSECNSRVLREKLDWKGLMMDGSNENAAINLNRESISPDNIVSLLEKHGVYQNGTDIGYFSEDTDFADYYIWRAILSAGYRPRILISEVNSNFLPHEAGTVHPPDPGSVRMWNGNNYYGVSPLALQRLWNKFGYFLVHCTKEQVNCFAVRADLMQATVNAEVAVTHHQVNQVQSCLLSRRQMYDRATFHPCDQTRELYVTVNEDGDVSSEGQPPQEFTPHFLQQCIDGQTS
jgi:hypothetical protein